MKPIHLYNKITKKIYKNLTKNKIYKYHKCHFNSTIRVMINKKIKIIYNMKYKIILTTNNIL